MEIVKPSPKAVNKVVAALKQGAVVVCPTDTVYGFLADASNAKAVAKIYRIKGREKKKPLPVFVSNIAMARQLAEVDDKTLKLLKKRWPGKYTFVLSRQKFARSDLAKLYGVDKKTIALRIPKHEFLQKVLRKFGGPIAQTSVNMSGQPSLADSKEIIEVFQKNRSIGIVVDAGKLKKSKSSSIYVMKDGSLIKLR